MNCCVCNSSCMHIGSHSYCFNHSPRKNHPYPYVINPVLPTPANNDEILKKLDEITKLLKTKATPKPQADGGGK